ncbi:MAG: pyrimidine 5'-nucleotidase [Chloroflexota bacterium]
MIKNRRATRFEYILFDLDDTLYPYQTGLMDAVLKRIITFMIETLNIPPDDAHLMRQRYYQQYGTTVRGLVEEQHIDPQPFLDFIHDIDPKEFFGASPPLNHLLTLIPLPKVIFTNSDRVHSERVLQTLQVRSHFEEIIDIQTVNYKSKPDPLAYQRALQILDVPAECCIMVEDSPRNLLPAKDLGMTTILVDTNHSATSLSDFTTAPMLHIDYSVPTVFHVERVLEKFLPMGSL